eukprot:scaffold803_cov310-Pinguiococcus_pyrenoidosus.AAC.37
MQHFRTQKKRSNLATWARRYLSSLSAWPPSGQRQDATKGCEKFLVRVFHRTASLLSDLVSTLRESTDFAKVAGVDS